MSDIPADALRETWDSVHEQSLKLAAMIEAHCVDTGERFDAIIVIPRGSYYPVNIVARELGFEAVDLIHASIGSYISGQTTRKNEFELGQMPTDAEISGKNLLIIDEVCETGNTLAFLTERLKQQGAALIRTGALHYKPDRTQTEFAPDWYVVKTDKWIHYPWESHDDNGKNSIVKRRG